MRWARYGAVVFAVCVLMALVFASRLSAGAPVSSGWEREYDMRVAEEWQKDVPVEDDSVVGGRVYVWQPYHLLLAIAPRELSVVLPVLFVIFSVLIVGSLADVMVRSVKEWWLVMAVLVGSPITAIICR